VPPLVRLSRLRETRIFAGVRYEWDDAKAAANLRKHAVAFEDAIAALEDPLRLERIDDRLAYTEDRLQVIGMARNGVLFASRPCAAKRRAA